MQEEWGFIDTGSQDASINMAIDELLLHWHSEGKIPPTLRFYRWAAPSLSIGRFQKAERTIDFNGIAKHNCQFVRRLTGGSAVLHDNELTYSLVVSEQHPAIPKSVREAYYILSKGVWEGYKNLGIAADYAIPKENTGLDRNPVCFEKIAYYEMTVEGKKISGNAQTRKKGVLLQHGSIPMSIDEQMLFDRLHFPAERVRQRRRDRFSQKAITINEYTNKTHEYLSLKEAFYKGFQTGLGITLKPFKLSKAQWEEVLYLTHTKYATESWNTPIDQGSVQNDKTRRIHT